MKFLIALAVATCLAASTAASVAPPQPQADDPLKFTRSGRMLLLYQVPAAGAQDFALTWQTIKDELAKSTDPGLTAFARTLDIQRVETEPGADALFIFDLDPVSTTYSYNPVTLLFTTLAAKPDAPDAGLSYDEATALWEKVKGAQATTWWLSGIGIR